LEAKYGVEGGRIWEGGSTVLGWCKDLCSVRDGVGVNNNRLFLNCVVQKVGNRENTSFWKDPWLYGVLFMYSIRSSF